MARRPDWLLMWRQMRWRLQGRDIRIGQRTVIAPTAEILATEDHAVILGRKCRIRQGAILDPRGGIIEMGDNCSVNPYSVLYGHGGLRIGSNVRIAAHVIIVAANHVFDDPDIPIVQQGLTHEGITIGDDVWIGAGARILDGVTIASGCVIAAGAVVTKSTEGFGIYAGVPARKVAVRGSGSLPPNP